MLLAIYQSPLNMNMNAFAKLLRKDNRFVIYITSNIKNI